MLAYFTGGLGLITVAATAYAATMRAGHTDLRHQLQDATFQLSACGGRLQTVLDDKGSDHVVDQIPDADLVDVPDHWLRP